MLQHGGDETDQRRALSDNDDLEKKLCKQAVFKFVRKHILEYGVSLIASNVTVSSLYNIIMPCCRCSGANACCRSCECVITHSHERRCLQKIRNVWVR